MSFSSQVDTISAIGNTLSRLVYEINANNIRPTHFLLIQLTYHKSLGENDRSRIKKMLSSLINFRRIIRNLSTDPDDIISIIWKSFNKENSSIYYTTSRLDETYVQQLTKQLMEETYEEMIREKVSHHKPGDFVLNYITSKNLEYVVDLESNVSKSISSEPNQQQLYMQISDLSMGSIHQMPQIASPPELLIIKDNDTTQTMMLKLSTQLDHSQPIIITKDMKFYNCTPEDVYRIALTGVIKQVILPEMWTGPIKVDAVSMLDGEKHMFSGVVAVEDRKEKFAFKFDTGATLSVTTFPGIPIGSCPYESVGHTGICPLMTAKFKIDNLKERSTEFLQLNTTAWDEID